MKVGDLVKYTREHKDLQYLTGIVVETADGIRFRHGTARVLWSDTPEPSWDWTSQLRVVNESR